MGLFAWLFGKKKDKKEKSEEKAQLEAQLIENEAEAPEEIEAEAEEAACDTVTETITPPEQEGEEIATEEETSDAITGRFEINKSRDGKKYFFNLYASNKVGIATSQMYSTAQSALIGVKSVIANAKSAPIEDQTLKSFEPLGFPKWIIYVDKGGKYRFHLAAANGSNVCHSQGYTTKKACKNGIDSIIRSSKNAEIDKAYLLKKNEDKA